MNRYFITGTDTDSGKTYVTCQLIDFLKAKARQVIALKPMASGCVEQDGELGSKILVSDDVLQLQTHLVDTTNPISGWRFEPPISPHLAAREVGAHISAKEILDFCLDPRFDHYEYQLIEGAGGLMAPFNEEETWLDLLVQSQIPVILVVGMRLGCLNHAMLTEIALHSQTIPCVGWIANCLDKDMLRLDENINTLIKKLKIPLIARVPFGGEIVPEACCSKVFC